jgi:hypothetical protein
MSLGQTLMSLVYTLPQLAIMMTIYRLVLNELLHITVEPVRPPEEKGMEEAVLEAVKHYKTVYQSPASIEDIGLHIYVRPAREMIDRTLTAERLAKVREMAEKLAAEGKLKKTEYGYEPVA